MPPKYKQSEKYSEIFNRLIELCEKNNTSVTAIARELTTSTSKLDTWKRGNINTDIIPKIVLRLNTSLEYLLTGKEKNSFPEQLSEEEQQILKYLKELPHDEQQQLIGMAILLKEQVKSKQQEQTHSYNKSIHKITKHSRVEMTTIRNYLYPVGAGVNTPPPKDDNYREVKIPSDFVPRRANSLIRVSGESMQPDYPDGCYIWVYMDIADSNIENFYGKPVVVNNNGELLLKIAGEDCLYSINDEFQEIFAGEGCTIIGDVIEIAEDKVVEFIENI